MRNTLVRLGETLCQTPEQFKAWSQNLGHDDVLTTFQSYDPVARRRQDEIIQGLAKPRQKELWDPTEFAEAVARELRRSEGHDSDENGSSTGF